MSTQDLHDVFVIYAQGDLMDNRSWIKLLKDSKIIGEALLLSRTVGGELLSRKEFGSRVQVLDYVVACSSRH